jgi:hypothetical protein
MIEWEAPPASVTWTLDVPVEFGGNRWPTVTLRAPTAGELQKATAVRGMSGLEATQRLISVVSAEGVPYEAVQKLPKYVVDQMDAYMDLFGATPYPGPLDAWLKRRAEAEKADAAAQAATPSDSQPAS